MRLTNISLVNYRKYAKAEIDFPDGLIGIIGPNGAGKSSLLEAVAWAFYGNPAARTSKEDIKRQGSALGDMCQVVLEMEMDGTEYQVVREMRGKNLTADAAIYAGKKVRARGVQATLDYAAQLLGMDRDSFFTSFFAKQKDLNALSDYPPAERRAMIIRMLGIDDIDRATELARADRRALEQEIKFYDRAKVDMNELLANLAQKEDAARRAKQVLTKKTTQARASGRETERLEAAFGKEQDRKDRRDELAGEYRLVKQDLAHYKDTLAATRQEESAILTATARGKGPRSVGQVDAALAGLKTKLERYQRDLGTARSAVEAAVARQSHLAEQRRELERERDLIQELGPDSRCPTCLRPLGEDFADIDRHFEAEIMKLAQEMERAEKQSEKKKTEEAKVSAAIVTLQRDRERLLELKPTLARLPELASLIADKEKTATRLRTKLDQLEAKGKKLGYSQTGYDRAKRHYEQAVAAQHALELALKDAERDLSLATQAQTTLKDQIKTARKLEREMARTRTRYQHLEKLIEVLGAFRIHLIGRIRPVLSEKASELVHTLTDGKYSQIELDEDYELFLYDNGQRFPIDRFSGGEKDLANLCLRLAISLALTEASETEFGFIVLDEIFGSQDTLRKSNIMRALANLSGRFRQIFVITHVEDIKDEMENVISVTEDDAGLSHLTLE